VRPTVSAVELRGARATGRFEEARAGRIIYAMWKVMTAVIIACRNVQRRAYTTREGK
jgi:hypothetical protein